MPVKWHNERKIYEEEAMKLSGVSLKQKTNVDFRSSSSPSERGDLDVSFGIKLKYKLLPNSRERHQSMRVERL